MYTLDLPFIVLFYVKYKFVDYNIYIYVCVCVCVRVWINWNKIVSI